MYEHREASGKLRTEEEVRKEIAERESAIRRRGIEQAAIASVVDLRWKALQKENDTDVHVIAVLRWVLGEDLLWE